MKNPIPSPPDSRVVPVVRFVDGKSLPGEAHLIEEAVLTVRVNGAVRFKAARTPGDEAAQAAGLCVGAGIPIRPEDINVCADGNTVEVTISDEDARTPRMLSPVTGPGKISVTDVIEAGKALHEAQVLRRKTQSTHAALLFGEKFSLLSTAEDVSRHSAIDKALGKAFLSGTLESARAVMLTCRQNSDVMIKIVHARVPVLISVSRPTVSALDTAKAYGLSVILLGRGDEVVAFCGEERLLP